MDKDVKNLIEKYTKELYFLNQRLNTALFIGQNQRIRINAEIIIYTEVINDLKKLNP